MLIESFVFLAASFLAAIAATLAGFGSSTLLIPVVTLFMDIKTAIFLVACFHLFNNLFKIKIFWNKIDFKIFLMFGIPSIVFAFVGAILISYLPIVALKKGLAGFLIVFSLYSFMQPKFSIKETKFNAILGGGLSGLLAGLLGLGGAIRATFLIAFSLAKEVYIGTSAMIAFVIDLTRIPTYLVTKTVEDNTYFFLLPFLLVSAFLGVKVGKKLLGRIDQEKFRKIVLVAIMAVGIKLLF